MGTDEVTPGRRCRGKKAPGRRSQEMGSWGSWRLRCHCPPPTTVSQGQGLPGTEAAQRPPSGPSRGPSLSLESVPFPLPVPSHEPAACHSEGGVWDLPLDGKNRGWKGVLALPQFPRRPSPVTTAPSKCWDLVGSSWGQRGPGDQEAGRGRGRGLPPVWARPGGPAGRGVPGVLRQGGPGTGTSRGGASGGHRGGGKSHHIRWLRWRRAGSPPEGGRLSRAGGRGHQARLHRPPQPPLNRQLGTLRPGVWKGAPWAHSRSEPGWTSRAPQRGQAPTLSEALFPISGIKLSAQALPARRQSRPPLPGLPPAARPGGRPGLHSRSAGRAVRPGVLEP